MNSFVTFIKLNPLFKIFSLTKIINQTLKKKFLSLQSAQRTTESTLFLVRRTVCSLTVVATVLKDSSQPASSPPKFVSSRRKH